MDIFVGSLSFKLKESELREAFEKYGKVSSAKIIIDKITRQSKGFGFVEMPDDDEAKLAISSLNGAEMYGRALVVNESQKREPGSAAPRGDFKREGFSRPRPTEGGDSPRSSSPPDFGSSGNTGSSSGGSERVFGNNDKPKGGGGDRRFGGNDRGGDRGGYANKSKSDGGRFGKSGNEPHKKGGGGSKKDWGRGYDDDNW